MAESTSPPGVAVVVNVDSTRLDVLCGLVRKAGFEPRPFLHVEAALIAQEPSNPPPT